MRRSSVVPRLLLLLLCALSSVWLSLFEPALSKPKKTNSSAAASQKSPNCPPLSALPAPPPLPPLSPPLTVKELKSFEAAVLSASDMKSLIGLGKKIRDWKNSTAINDVTARRLYMQILQKQRRLGGDSSLEVAHTLSDYAWCFSLKEQSNAIPALQEAFSIASKQLRPADPLVLQLQAQLVRELVLSHQSQSKIVEASPLCPHCHAKKAVVPVFGFVPFSQDDYNYRFVNRTCTGPLVEWYCRKCKGAFFPYSTDTFIIDMSKR